MAHDSLWKAITSDFKRYPTLTAPLEADVVIIGAGITGVTTAYNLMKTGKRVMLLEAHAVGESTTGYSTGNLYIPVEQPFHTLVSHFTQDQVIEIIDSRQKALEHLEDIIQSEGIECDYLQRPAYYYASEIKNVESLEKEINFIKKSRVIVEEADLSEIPFKAKKIMKLPYSAKFNPLAYIKSLCEILANQGVTIFEHSQALSVEEKEGKYVVLTDSGSIRATHLVMATHAPKGISVPELLSPGYRSYAVAFKLKQPRCPNGRYVDYDAPHYITSSHASRPGGKIDCMVVAGSHHRVASQPDHKQPVRSLEAFMHQHFEVKTVEYTWSAQHYRTPDEIPYIGALKKNYYIATGFYADGLVYGTLASQLISDLIQGKANALESIYAPSRPNFLAKAKMGIKESLFLAKEFLKDLPHHVQAHDFKDIAKEEAKTIEIKGEKFGAYRDATGGLHVVSGVCTHMKCLVKWNNFEKTWDCPCHGSRFSKEGVVLEGPAYHNLMKITVRES